ncbi:MAG: type II toxin-antitoxin system VapC family toxin [Candidatus Micrarchaeaceae archaeon]
MLIDTSVIVRFFAKGSDWESLEDYVMNSVTLQIALDELGNALSRKVRSSEMGLEDAADIIASYPSMAQVIGSSSYRKSALDIAVKNNLSFYDSLFISAAVSEGTSLATCDRKQADVAEKLGVAVEYIK